MLPNEVFALECLARYAREGLVRDSTWEFAHCPYPRPKGQKRRLPGDLGYYLTFFDHQHQGLLQSVDVGRRCYIPYQVLRYLDTWPPGCFELWDIYDKFNKNTEEHNKNISQARMGALHPHSKAVIVIQSDGTKLHFGSSHEAARNIGMNQAAVWRYLNKGNSPRWGKFKDWQFFYAVKE